MKTKQPYKPDGEENDIAWCCILIGAVGSYMFGMGFFAPWINPNEPPSTFWASMLIAGPLLCLSFFMFVGGVVERFYFIPKNCRRWKEQQKTQNDSPEK